MNKNNVTALVAGGVVVGMVGLSFAAVPLYRLFCQVTGYGGTPQTAAAPEQAKPVRDGRRITISMVGNASSKLPWSFAPVKAKVVLAPGEQVLAHYRAKNLSDAPVTGVATFNVTPHKVGPYFAKVACFCFTEQTLQPGESVDMPVTFYIDPEMLKDRKMDDVTDIALSYTFFRAPEDGDRKLSGLSPEGKHKTN